MKRALWLSVAFAAGFWLCFQLTQWRVGAAEGMRDLYAVGAAKAFQALDECKQPKPGIFK